ncbi:alpha/beta fold hydrolase BchO [uncultured Tateyamaria sp.]|uniref:alpha/beta fold hydrolase BchO n=1 Tax=Tateyamaria sp. 1078 TaxID=3417464 RepID=UPI00260EB7BB|nr:alpha/beta fold hydrolase BchO [uncultured Tateyamaria sp.]
MDWAQIGGWPLHQMSRRIDGPIHRWHAQVTGSGPTLLLLHGAGGSTHSYRDLIPLLSAAHHVVALDLPGHGFSQLGARQRSGLEAMAEDVAALCAQEGWRPAAIIGHSAGAAVALQMARDMVDPPHVIGLNAALGEFPGLAGLVFPLMAKALAAMPFATTLFSTTSANPARIKALIASTGSALDAEGYDLYRQLVGDKAHVDGTLRMMAQWDLRPLLAALPRYAGHVDLIAGSKDATVPPSVSQTSAGRMPNAEFHQIEGLGHLMHEEAPEQLAALILRLLHP